MPRLTTLKSGLARLPAKVAQPAGVERKRGRAGMADRHEIRQRDKGLCQACLLSGLVTLGTEVDHTVPLADGGSDTPDNKQLLCSPCHAAKSATEAAQRARG